MATAALAAPEPGCAAQLAGSLRCDWVASYWRKSATLDCAENRTE